MLRTVLFLSIPLLVQSTPLYRFDNRESAPSSPPPSPSADQLLSPIVDSDKHYEEAPKSVHIEAKEEKATVDEGSRVRQLPSVILEQNLKLEAVSGSLEDNGKEQERPNCETLEADSEDDDPPEDTGKVPILKPRFSLVPVPCTEKELSLPHLKEDKSEQKKLVQQPSIVEIARIPIDASLSPPAPNKSSFAEKHIDVTLRELDQPVALVGDETVEDEEDTGGSLGIDMNISPSDLEEELMDHFDPECDKFSVTPSPSRPTEADRLGQRDRIVDYMDSDYEEQFFRITAYFLSLFADVLDDEPSTWQKIIAGVQCVLRDCREALPFRPSDRPMIKEGGFIIRRARESLCTCYIPGLTDN